ncbi:MAG: hypothetical protein ACKO6N_28745 [Myxococcota bacterium]
MSARLRPDAPTPSAWRQRLLESASEWLIQSRLQGLAALEPLTDQLWRTLLTRARAQAMLLEPDLSAGQHGLWPWSLRHQLRLGWIPQAFVFALLQLELRGARGGLLLVVQPFASHAPFCVLSLTLSPRVMHLSWALLRETASHNLQTEVEPLINPLAHKREALGGQQPLPTSWQENGAGFALQRPLAYIEEGMELGLSACDRWMQQRERAVEQDVERPLSPVSLASERSAPLPLAWILEGLPHREVLERRWFNLAELPWLSLLSNPAQLFRVAS